MYNLSRSVPLALLSIAAFGTSSALAGSGSHRGHVSLSHIVRGDEGHEAVGRATIVAGSPLIREQADGGVLLRLRGDASAPCHPHITLYVTDLATSSPPRSQVNSIGPNEERLHAIASGHGSAGPWRLDEISDTAYGVTATHRRWLGTSSFRIAHNRFSQIELSGTADLNCSDDHFLHGPVVTSITHLLATALVDARIRRARKL
jgi:hypothetical protein